MPLGRLSLGDGTRKNCIKNCADLRITRELFDTKTWNESSIEKRSEKLMQDFFNIWDIVSIL